MKGYISVLLFMFTLTLIAQEEVLKDSVSSNNFNEIKLNGLYLVVGAFEVNYERTLNEESGVGLNVFIPFDEDLKEDINFYVSPYYRLYFGKKYAGGFFVEGFAMLSSYNDTQFKEFGVFGSALDPFFVDTYEEKIIDFALGIGIGGKWITNNGFIGELNLGFGRNFFNSEESGVEITGKVGISIGYRF
jgi:hypothetical protein